jgi:hypothetical protein
MEYSFLSLRIREAPLSVNAADSVLPRPSLESPCVALEPPKMRRVRQIANCQAKDIAYIQFFSGHSPMPQRMTNYKLGSVLSLTTAFLIATHEPFTSQAAKHLTFVQFVCLTQLCRTRA